MRSLVAIAGTLVALAAAVPAAAQTGVAVRPAAPVPDGARTLGPLCRADTPSFRLWWTDTPGAPGAVAGVDGSCATPPRVITELAGVAEAARVRAITMGFPAMTGDAPPAHLRSPALLRALVRTGPAVRARSLGRLARPSRGSFLAGLTAAQRTRVLRALPRALRTRLLAEVRVALRGRPTDFVGGDRRVDVVVDGTGASGLVQRLQPGLSPCRVRPVGRRRDFVAAWAVVLAPPDAPAPRSVLTHELFHVAQCAMGVGPGTPLLLREGTAEWFGALTEPAGFPGPVGPGGGTITSGNARAASFCDGFDPAGPGTAPYASWPVWEALDPGASPSTTVRAILRAFPGGAASPPPAAAVIARVGAARWAEGLRAATREVCGNRRSPSGAVAIDPAVRSFLGGRTTPATTTAPAALTVPAGGVATIGAIWGAAAVSAVTVVLSSPQAAPDALAASAVVTTAAGPVPVTVRDGTAIVDVPPAAFGERYVPVTIANPALAGAATVQVRVVATGL